MPIPRRSTFDGRIDIDQLLEDLGPPTVSMKPYTCTNCGNQTMLSTNHYGECYPLCRERYCQQPVTHVFDYKRALVMKANGTEVNLGASDDIAGLRGDGRWKDP